jgi:uncharacterized protein
MKKLRISPDLALPLDVVTTTIAVLGIRNSGKTNTCVVLTEELFDAGQQVVIIDPTDVWWGLKSSKNGKQEGYPVVVFGGRHGDVPLTASDGATVADFIVEERLPAILSLRHFESQADQRRFVTEFARRLYHRKGEEGRDTPMLLVIDEAHLFVPQRVTGAEAPMVGAVQKLVRQGRSSGIGVAIIDQRPASVNKDVLTQIELLICHRTTSPQDSRALEAWIEQNDTEDQRAEFLKRLPELERGVAWCWSPGWLKLFKRVAIRARETFDSSATPKAGEKRVTPTTLAHIDLNALKKKMAAAIEKAQADDPKALRAELARARKEIEDMKKSAFRKLQPEPSLPRLPKRVEVPVLTKKQEQTIDALLEAFRKMKVTHDNVIAKAERAIQANVELKAKLGELARTVGSDGVGQRTAARPSASKANGTNGGASHRPVPTTSQRPATSTRATVETNGAPIGAGVREVLVAIAQHADGVTRTQITILTGYKRSTRDAYIQRLVVRGFCTAGSLIRATDAGIAELGDEFEPLPTGKALREHWLKNLPEGERKVFALLTDSFPTPLSRDEITTQTKYKRSTRDAYIQRLGVRKLVVADSDGIAAARELFDD